jgi:hypothetical protein
MPSNLSPAAPQGVMPKQLAQAFTMEMRLELLSNVYPDGSSERTALAQNVRAYFHLTQAMNATDWHNMFNFYQAHLITPFYFYNLRETVPMGSWDATGQDPVGRYTVVFDGAWGDVYQLPRMQVQLSLREVA